MCTVRIGRGLRTLLTPTTGGTPVSAERLSLEVLKVVPGSLTDLDGKPAVSVRGFTGEFQLPVRLLLGAEPEAIIAAASSD